MKTIATDLNNDIYLDNNGNLAIAFDIEAVRQGCEQAAKTLLGEMIFAIDEGIPMFDAVWIRQNLAQFEFRVRRAFRAVDGVMDVLKFDIATNNETTNNLQYQADIKTIYGIVSING